MVSKEDENRIQGKARIGERTTPEAYFTSQPGVGDNLACQTGILYVVNFGHRFERKLSRNLVENPTCQIRQMQANIKNNFSFRIDSF